MVLILAGFASGAYRADGLLIVGFSLVSVAGLELALREHVVGYRSPFDAARRRDGDPPRRPAL